MTVSGRLRIGAIASVHTGALPHAMRLIRDRHPALEVAVFPNDVVVADGDGAVVIPAALLDEVAVAAVEQERLEAWIMKEVEKGVPLPGLYPPNDEAKARYEAWKKTRR